MEQKVKIYVDDVRTPVERGWMICRNYEEFVDLVNKTGIENIEKISLDHDLGETAQKEYFNNVVSNYIINYDNIYEKTGYDCAKWIVDQSIDTGIPIPTIVTHSANPVGSANIMGYINNYLKNCRLPQICVRIQIPHTIHHE
jgi:5-formaminoimidazole-4-carboxamide-1-beta-D-ribofuranosyl 5'-monophosphate synthetase